MSQETIHIVILDDYHGFARNILETATLPNAWELSYITEHIDDQEQLRAELLRANVIVANRERTALSADLIQSLPDLELIVTTGMANDSIAQVAGIPIVGTRSLVTPTVELTWALIHAMSRRIVEQAISLRRGNWQSHLGRSLEGKTLGLVGVGKIGSRVARVARAFDMRVIGWSQNLSDEQAAEAGVERVSKTELFEQSDIVSVHVRLSERSLDLIGSTEFALMKSSAFLVNTSRSAIVNQSALFAALQTGQIAGAALDVYPEEPVGSRSEYLGLPNTVLTPHLGYATAENFELFYGDAVESIQHYFAGDPVRVIFAG